MNVFKTALDKYADKTTDPSFKQYIDSELGNIVNLKKAVVENTKKSLSNNFDIAYLGWLKNVKYKEDLCAPIMEIP